MNKQIIDIHAHILPGVDDGSSSWEETKQMLQIAYSHGIRTIIATPHYSSKQKPEELRALAAEVAKEARRMDPQYQVCLGQEIQYFDDIVNQLRVGHALTMADSPYVLVEFMPGVSYQTLLQGTRKLVQSGYIPILAHVERYMVLRKNDYILELRQLGCCLQMNYSSIEGSPLQADVRWCRRQILKNRVDFLATDMHREAWRAPTIRKSLDWLEKRVDPQTMDRLIQKNSSYIIRQQS